MPTPTKGPRLGGGPAHERLMLANLATALFEHGRITTTEAKAKRLRPLAERLITFAKRGDLHARRRVLKVMSDKTVVHTLFAEIGPGFAQRPGGYTRITKLGPRKGDNAPMAVIELVEPTTVAQQAVGEAERARGSRFSRDIRPTGGAASAGTRAGESVPAEGDADGSPDAPREQVAVAAEGGDTEVVTEPARAADRTDQSSGSDQSGDVADEAGDQPAEDVTSDQTTGASDEAQAEGDRD